MSGEGDVINTSGQTTLNGDLSRTRERTARGGKVIIASNINTQPEDDIFDVQTLSAENGGTLILNATAGSTSATGWVIAAPRQSSPAARWAQRIATD